MSCSKKPCEIIVEKGENAGDQHFLVFPQCFLNTAQDKLNLLNSI